MVCRDPRICDRCGAPPGEYSHVVMTLATGEGESCHDGTIVLCDSCSFALGWFIKEPESLLGPYGCDAPEGPTLRIFDGSFV